MAELMEMGMMICFGLSWPASIIRSWRARTSKGKSIFFMSFILVGYLLGIASKLVSGNVTFVVIVYALNTVLVAVDICLYFRNVRLDRLADRA